MTDEEMADFLGFPKDELWRLAAVQNLSPEKRSLFECMAGLEIELNLWEHGLAPKPKGVLIDTERSTRRRRAWQ